MRKIICIGRQFGSGGHNLAHALAEHLAIPYYDKKILEDAVIKSGMRAEIMKKAEEQLPNSLLHSIYYEGNSTEYYGKSANEILYMAQRHIILEYAEESDCIIVGRCADAILKESSEYAVKSIFVTAPMEYRIAATMQKDHLEEKAAASLVRKSDKKRSAYYAYHTSKDWGKASDYDFCFNTATNGMDILVDLLDGIYRRMG